MVIGIIMLALAGVLNKRERYDQVLDIVVAAVVWKPYGSTLKKSFSAKWTILFGQLSVIKSEACCPSATSCIRT